MPRCEGRPEGACPARVIDNSVRLCQGDLMLCKACEDHRFPSTSSHPLPTIFSDACSVQVSSDALQSTSDKQLLTDGDEHVPIPQHGERNSNTVNRKLVANELLFFVNNHIDTTPVASLKTVIVEFYREEEIMDAKQKLLLCFSDLKTHGLNVFAKNRIGVHKAKASVDDIFGIFSTLDEKSLLDTLPLFCAVNAKRVPVLPEDRSDLASIRYDLARLKEQFDTLIRTQASVCAAVEQQSSAERTLSMDSGANSSPAQQSGDSDQSSAQTFSDQSSSFPPLQSLPEPEDVPKQDTSKVTYSNASRKYLPKKSGKTAVALNKVGSSHPVLSAVQGQSDDGFQMVSHQKHRKNKGKSVVGGNKNCASFQGVVKKSVFCVSRLAVDVEPEMVTDFLTANSITVFSCYKAKHSDYFNTMRLCVPAPDAKKVCLEELWPYGVVVRPWVFKPSGNQQ